MYIWIFPLILAMYLLKFFWRLHTHPSQVLCRQASNMNWRSNGFNIDEQGTSNLKLKRNNIETIILYKRGRVQIVNPWIDKTFVDFIEVEKFLANRMEKSESTIEDIYYQHIDEYINLNGYYQQLLEAQGTDEEFYLASIMMHKAAFQSGQSEKVVGALTMDAVNRHKVNRKLGIIFLQTIESKFINSEKTISNRDPSLRDEENEMS